MLQAPSLVLVLVIFIILGAAIYDAKTFTIPHVFPLALIALFIAAAFYVGLRPVEWGLHTFSAVIGFGAALLLYIVGPMGGGDVKLFAAIALWVKPSGLIGLVISVSLAGLIIGLAALVFIMARSRIQTTKNTSWRTLYTKAKKTRLPYGPAIAIGSMAHFWIT